MSALPPSVEIMRILHTSDWHLGRSFHRESMLGAQSAYADHLADVVVSEGVDVIVVSGDVYDRALPPVDAVCLANDIIRRLMATGVQIVMTSGNHDSAQRLGFASDLLGIAGLHLRTSADAASVPVLLDHGSDRVAVYGIPYLEPDLVRGPWAVEGRSHQAVLDEAMRRVRIDLASRPTVTRSVVMAHAFVSSATPCDSERDISVGGISTVAVSTFAGIDYAALGHLHGRQTLTETIRYSGSPLPYSFSEARHRKGCWIADLGPARPFLSWIDAPVPRRLAMLSGRLDELMTSRRFAADEGAWAHVTLTDPIRPIAAMDRIRTRFPHALVIAYAPSTDDSPVVSARADRTTAPDLDVVTDFFVETRGSAPTPGESVVLAEACEACRLAEDVAS